MKELKKEEMLKVEGGWSVTVGRGPVSVTVEDEDVKKVVEKIKEINNSEKYKERAKKRIESSKKDGSGFRPSHDGFGR